MWLVYGTYGKDVGLFFFFLRGVWGVWGRFIESLQPFYKLEVCIILTRDIFLLSSASLPDMCLNTT